MLSKILPFFLCLVIVLFSREVDLFSFGAGIHDIIRKKHRTCEFRMEYRPYNTWATVRPLVGVMLTGRGSFYGYGGFWFDWVVQKHLTISPNFAVGYYAKGFGKDLGFPLEFRSGIELGWRFSNEVRIGANFYHISNASLGKKNPGEESLVFFISIPINRPSSKR